MNTCIIGIDPGLVHTGVVALMFDTSNKVFRVEEHVINGLDADKCEALVLGFRDFKKRYVFVEDYNPRSNFNTDKRMIEGVRDIVTFTGGKRINNAGVKKVVRRELMKQLNLWTFANKTNHQDLRSAAYIAIYGMLKDEELNRLLYDVVMDRVAGACHWTISD